MSTKSERVTILTSPEFKAFLNAEAEKEGVSVAELIRVRCERPAMGDNAEELLAQLTSELKAATARAAKSLDQGMEKAAAALAQIEARRASNAQ